MLAMNLNKTGPSNFLAQNSEETIKITNLYKFKL